MMFLPAVILWAKDRKGKPEVVSYIDKMISNTWTVVLELMILSLVVIVFSGLASGVINLQLMLPLALIFVCTGTLITSLTINEGTLSEQGTHQELMNIPNGKYKTLYEMQFGKIE